MLYYIHTQKSASALKGCKIYSSRITIIMYLPISYVVFRCLDLKQEIFNNALSCTPTKDSVSHHYSSYYNA